MSVEIQRPLPAAIARQQRRRIILALVSRSGGYNSLALQTQFPNASFQQVRARQIIIPRRILRGNRHQFPQQSGHLFLALPRRILRGNRHQFPQQSGHLFLALPQPAKNVSGRRRIAK